MQYKALFDQIHNIPSIPKVVQELMDDFENEDTSPQDIGKKIQMDQSISLKIMRLANSARYGAGRKVNSIDSAIVMLGRDTLKTLVIASGVTSAFKEIPGLDKKAFWRTSFSIASIAKLIAKLAKLDGEMAFTCGMLHNIGDTLLYIVEPDKMTRIDTLVASGAVKSELQKSQFDLDYTDIGSELARRWNFPDEIVDAIRYQERPTENESQNPYAYTIKMACLLFSKIDNGDREDILKDFPTDIAKELNVDLLEIQESLVELFEAEDDIEVFLQ